MPEIPSREVADYCIALADDTLVLSQRLVYWVTRSPELEIELAMANIGLDLLGQARSLLAYGGSADGRTEDDLAYLRQENEFRNLKMCEIPGHDFGEAVARLLLFSTFQRHLYDGLTGSSDPILAAVATKAVKEVRYHQVFAGGWTTRLGDGTSESHERMQAGLVRLWPYVAELFDDDPVVGHAPDGVAIDPRTFAEAWRADVEDVISAATLTVPETWTSPSGGRRGVHTEHLGGLLSEMQHVHRVFPRVDW